MWLKINTDTKKHGQELAAFLRSIEYIKSVEIDEILDEDWGLPGRPATNDELERLADNMINDEGGKYSKDFFDDLKNKLIE